jgi:cysteine desulfurase
LVVYLDNAATTPLDQRVLAAMQPWLGARFGNPSSRHRLGVEAAEALETARAEVARATGARRERVVFTSGGTEANNLGVLGAARARARHGRHVLVGPTEHASVREPAAALRSEGFEVESLRLTGEGGLDLDHLAARIRPDTVLVAQMLVQNEFASVYPVRQVARIVRARAPRAALHVDAVQALGKLELSLSMLGATTLAISAHKAHGPMGAGALVCAEDAELRPLVHGGHQQGGLRPGTECVANVVGLGATARLAEEEREASVRTLESLRARLCAGIERVGGARVFAPGAAGHAPSPAIVALLLSGIPAEVALHHLEERGVIVSAGSACQARKSEVSPALAALGLQPEDARCVLRMSLSKRTTPEEIDVALGALESVCTRLAGSWS